MFRGREGAAWAGGVPRADPPWPAGSGMFALWSTPVVNPAAGLALGGDGGGQPLALRAFVLRLKVSVYSVRVTR